MSRNSLLKEALSSLNRKRWSRISMKGSISLAGISGSTRELFSSSPRGNLSRRSRNPGDHSQRRRLDTGRPDPGTEPGHHGMGQLPSPHCGEENIPAAGCHPLEHALEVGQTEALNQEPYVDCSVVLALGRHQPTTGPSGQMLQNSPDLPTRRFADTPW